VAANRDVSELDPELQQPVRQPRAVRVAHATREHLGARHHNARAGAHAQGLGPTITRWLWGRKSKPIGSEPAGTDIRLPFAAIRTARRPRLIRRWRDFQDFGADSVPS